MPTLNELWKAMPKPEAQHEEAPEVGHEGHQGADDQLQHGGCHEHGLTAEAVRLVAEQHGADEETRHVYFFFGFLTDFVLGYTLILLSKGRAFRVSLAPQPCTHLDGSAGHIRSHGVHADPLTSSRRWQESLELSGRVGRRSATLESFQATARTEPLSSSSTSGTKHLQAATVNNNIERHVEYLRGDKKWGKDWRRLSPRLAATPPPLGSARLCSDAVGWGRVGAAAAEAGRRGVLAARIGPARPGATGHPSPARAGQAGRRAGARGGTAARQRGPVSTPVRCGRRAPTDHGSRPPGPLRVLDTFHLVLTPRGGGALGRPAHQRVHQRAS
ncbi:50S ribosomal protein L16 [Frankliniella fusca]|uniref:50S ribosomal protein L16 n=1 Tax=Frankliniella fusca TaxID=407009 RepID=A0AAE1HR43_9NEOP|nr:50S ribosomal protein L16 [Frankliniella fusca]